MNLVMYRGDDRDFEVTLTEAGVPIDLTGYTLKFTATTDIDDTTPVFVLDSTVAYEGGFEIDIDPDQAGAGAGKAVLHVQSADTVDLARGLTLLCDIQMTDGDGHIRTAPDPEYDESTLIRLRIRADVTV